MAFIPTTLYPRLHNPLQNGVQRRRRGGASPHITVAPIRMGRRSDKIKSRKDAQTLARTKIFARVGKSITMAAKAGGPDLIANKALADAIDQAKAVNFPKDTMEKAIARATSGDQADFKASSFEAYGHGGVGIYIDVLTDNANRAAADIRTTINKQKMKIATPGSVAFNFARKGVVRISKGTEVNDDDLLLAAIEVGAEECETDPMDDDMYRILAEPADLKGMQQGLRKAGYEFELPLVEMVPKAFVEVDNDTMDLNMNAVDALQALDDVDGVYMNGVAS